MADNRYAAFPDTGLSTRFRKAYEFSKEAHFRSTEAGWHPLLTGPFHPVSLAKACLEARLPAYAVEAAILHDVVERTPVDFDHIESCFDMEVSELIYEFSLSKQDLQNLQNLTVEKYVARLANASQHAQIIKQLDLMQTLTHLGTASPARVLSFVQWAEASAQAMTRVPEVLSKRGQYVCKWAKRREYEARVNEYRHVALQTA